MLLSKETINKNTVGYGLLSRENIYNNTIFGPIYSIGGIDSYTKLMLHMNGANGSTTFTDSSLTPKTVTTSGNAQISTAQYKYGGASGLFDGTGDYLSVPDSNDFHLSSNDFTFDFWMKKNEQNGVLFSQATNGSTDFMQLQYITASKQLVFQVYTTGQTTITIGNSNNITDTNWHHIAIVRNGNIWTMYIDGTANASQTQTHTVGNYTSAFFIGNWALGSVFYNGYIDEFRFSNGIARWTSNFTPPTSEYTI